MTTSRAGPSPWWKTRRTQMRELPSTHSREAASVGLIAGGSSLKIDFQVIQGHRLAGESFTSVWRQLVPLKHRRVVFQHLHDIAHPGRLTTHRLISSRFVWQD